MAQSVQWATIQKLCDERQRARIIKDYDSADRLREQLVQLGVVLHDETHEWKHPSGMSGSYLPPDEWGRGKDGPKGLASIPKSANHVPTEGDWTCGRCHNVNWGHRTRCNRCGQARPSGTTMSYRDTLACEAQEQRE
eukprot:Sspe_Gene.120026::Locus_117640_Transcript_1_1_Confidence_1.000_Length_469::g.120026::m.120026